MTFGYVVIVACGAVFVAELVGDKSVYNIASLSLRFRAGAVFSGLLMAFAGKMLVAVLLAGLLLRLHFWTNLLSAVAFFASAFLIWIKKPETKREHPVAAGWWQAVAFTAASLLLTEWGDPSQVAVAALVVKSHLMFAPWLGGTLAMAAKGGLAVTVGVKLRDRIPHTMLRTVAAASFCVLGLLALSGLAFP